ncbi:hypothetical protein KO493_07515 [Tamlana agarivorans]|uniref:Uncharacterized protein n=1 Tax=Pseudotamlana agarivorans TaxID=481183 RepID=A0ACC5U8C5_9FLAO|nr:hypothetical protein [Tamlana agarivorans]MBU2950540.1 hypothetical protein [Tamlana agarivorans]
MKRLVLAVLIAIGVTFLVTYTYNQSQQETATESKLLLTFKEGWRDGYCAGWKIEKGENADCPTAPEAPVCDDCSNTYKLGFSKGFKAGRNSAQ